VLSLGAWYHLAGAHDAAGRRLDPYVNGVLDNAALMGRTPAAQFNATVEVNIVQ